MSYFKTKDKKDCCACSACIHSCPVQAIKFERDEEGFDYPIINNEICINCGLCEKVCPVAHPIYDNEQYPKTYALYLRDVKERQRSSSGGVFYAIALWVLERGGVVFGSIIDEQNQVYHIGVDNLQDLQQLRGSKYVQSALKNVFKEIKSNLQAGRWCYFVGTGCQVAGLNAYLRKKYDTLITSDLVCHGVPSQWMFDQHINYLEKKYKGRVSDYRFRDNKIGGGSEIFRLTTVKGKQRTVTNPTYFISPYLYSFMYAMTYRYSCYDCKFAKVPRQGDITLADFWGYKDFFSDIDGSKGVSLCLLNTKLGINIFELIKDKFEYRSSNVADASKNNSNLVKSSIQHESRVYIYNKVRDFGYEEVAANEFRNNNYRVVWINYYINKSPILKSILKMLSQIKHMIKG